MKEPEVRVWLRVLSSSFFRGRLFPSLSLSLIQKCGKKDEWLKSHTFISPQVTSSPSAPLSNFLSLSLLIKGEGNWNNRKRERRKRRRKCQWIKHLLSLGHLFLPLLKKSALHPSSILILRFSFSPFSFSLFSLVSYPNFCHPTYYQLTLFVDRLILTFISLFFSSLALFLINSIYIFFFLFPLIGHKNTRRWWIVRYRKIVRRIPGHSCQCK